MAEAAPASLVKFLYHLTRDFIPLGVIEHALERTRSDRDELAPGAHKDYCVLIARQLAYDPTVVDTSERSG